jgi:hypothetical protein
VKGRNQRSEELQVNDPRNEEERMMASDLISEALPEAKADALGKWLVLLLIKKWKWMFCGIPNFSKSI